MDKVEVRSSFRGRVVDKNISKTIIEKLLSLKEYKEATLILAYYPLSDEVDITPLFNDQTKEFAYPVIDKDKMYFAFVERGVKRGAFNINQPLGAEIKSFPINTLMLMPAVAYDKEYRRIGRGKGFYDRFTKAHPSLTKVALISKDRLIDECVTNSSDVKADILITEISMLRIKALGDHHI